MKIRPLAWLGAVPMILLACATVGCKLLDDQQRRDPAVLEEGRQLAEQWCTQCHKLYEPPGFSDTEWVVLVRDMGRRAHLTPLQSEKVLAWLQFANDQ